MAKRKHVQQQMPKRRKINQDADLDVVEAKYLLEQGLRKVLPYWYLYETFAKGRWLNRTLFDVFVKEFQDQPAEYYQHAITTGLIRVNGEQVSINYLLKNNDRVSHHIHRHEPPVTSEDISIVYDGQNVTSDTHLDDGNRDLLVVDKPGSIPVHPSGRYRHNTVLHIVMKSLAESNTPIMSEELTVIPKVYALNRIDRLTSGVLILCRNRQAIPHLERQFRERLVRKEYLCRVKGVFPKDAIRVEQPIRVISHKLGLHSVHVDGKPSITHFLRLSTNGYSSVVLARPVTGRTHQIRVHLLWLGYPILNDPLYGIPGSSVWPKIGDLVNLQTGELKQLSIANTEVNTENTKDHSSSLYYTNSQLQDIVYKMDKVRTANDFPFVTQLSDENESDTFSSLTHCSDCTQPQLPDPQPHQLFIYLHAYLYELATTQPTTEVPVSTQQPQQDEDKDHTTLTDAFLPFEFQSPGVHKDITKGTTIFVSKWPEWANEDYDKDKLSLESSSDVNTSLQEDHSLDKVINTTSQ